MVQPRHMSEAGFQNVRCRGQGCGAVGKAMLEGYCNKCYVKEQSARLTEAASRGSTSPPVLVSCSALYHSLMTACNEVFTPSNINSKTVFYLSVQCVQIKIYFSYLFVWFCSFAISERPNHVQWRHSARSSAGAVAVRTYHLAARTCARTA